MRRIGYVLGAAWQGFWRNPVMSIAATLTVSLMLLLFAFFIVTDRGLQAAVAALESKVELVLYRVIQEWKLQDKIKQALTDTGWDLGAAAGKLGMKATTLERKVKKWGWRPE